MVCADAGNRCSPPRPRRRPPWGVCEPKLEGGGRSSKSKADRSKVTSRNGHDLTDRVPAVTSLGVAGDVVLDGELVHDDGSMWSFYELARALQRRAAASVVFDVLAACERTGIEGVVLKRARSIYRSGQRASDRRKVKCAAWREHLERRIGDLRSFGRASEAKSARSRQRPLDGSTQPRRLLREDLPLAPSERVVRPLAQERPDAVCFDIIHAVLDTSERRDVAIEPGEGLHR